MKGEAKAYEIPPGVKGGSLLTSLLSLSWQTGKRMLYNSVMNDLHARKTKQFSAAVVGAVNIDICGKPHKPLIPCDSNPGTVYTSVGGVGCNIAQNLKLLGADVKLITAIGGDAQADRVIKSCEEIGIDISDALIVKGAATSCYVFITDETGDMRLAVNDMAIYEYLTPEFLAAKMDAVNSAHICIADTNIPKESLEYLAENCAVPIVCDPVSVSKSYKLENIIGRLHTLKPNIIEAEYLAGIPVTDEASLKAAAEKLLETGLKRVFITLGKDGVYYMDGREEGTLPCMPHTLVNTLGAGDSFTAAVSWAYMHGLSARDTAIAGLTASALSLECEAAVNVKLNEEELLKRSGIKI